MNKSIAKQYVEFLKREYPDAKCSLDFESPLQLAVATILSAQSTDLRVADFVADAVRDTVNMAGATDVVTVVLNDGSSVGMTLRLRGEASKDYYLRFSTANELFTVFEGTHNGLIKKPEEYRQGGA